MRKPINNLKLILLFIASIIIINSCAREDTSSIIEAYCYPNPFSPTKEIKEGDPGYDDYLDIISPQNGEPVGKIYEFTRIYVNFIAVKSTTITLVIYDHDGNKVWSTMGYIGFSGNDHEVEVETIWGGENDFGETVNPGLYFCDIIIDDGNTSKKRIDIWVE